MLNRFGQLVRPWLGLGATLLDWAWPLALLGLFLECSYGYHQLARFSAAPDMAARWLFQMGLAIQVIAACSVALYLGRGQLHKIRRIAFLAAGLLGIIEQSQTLFCDGAAWGIWFPVANDETLCEKEWGQWPYKVAIALSLSFLIAKGVRKWTKQA